MHERHWSPILSASPELTSSPSNWLFLDDSDNHTYSPSSLSLSARYYIVSTIFLPILPWLRFPRQRSSSLVASTKTLYLTISPKVNPITSLDHPIYYWSPDPSTESYCRSRVFEHLTYLKVCFDLIWCLGLISPVESRSGSPPLLSWTRTT